MNNLHKIIDPHLDNQSNSHKISPIIFFPHAGGSPRVIHKWGQDLPKIRLYGITYPGRDHRLNQKYEDILKTVSIEYYAQVIAEELSVVFNNQKLILVGHSFGSFIAYETAVYLQENHNLSAQVIISGQNSPHEQITTQLHTSSDDALIADVIRQNPDNANLWQQHELKTLFLPSLRADYRLLETYCPSLITIDDISIIYGHEDPEINVNSIEAWLKLSRVQRKIYQAKGKHFYFLPPDKQLLSFIITSSRSNIL